MAAKDAVETANVVKTSNYLNFDEYTLKMRKYAEENEVPIIKDEGLVFLKNIINLKKPINVLEVGTAIGYSASQMASLGANVYTIERDPKMYEEASKNIEALNLKDKVHITFGDALEVFDNFKDIKFDLLFIDAAKAQYEKFFNIYTPLLNENGIVVCDNMLFHGLVDDANLDEMSRSLRGLIRKLRAFTDFLSNNDEYDTAIYDIGDGMAVSVKK